MDLSLETVAKIIAGLVTALVAARRASANKPRLVVYYTHAAAFVGYGLQANTAVRPSPAPLPPPPSVVSAEPPNAEPAGSALAAASAVPAAPAAPPVLFSHSIAIRNLGRGTANNVRIGHNRRPPSVTTAPKLFYQHGDTPEGGWEILIPTIVAKESIQIAYMYPNTYTWRDINTYCKSDEGSAEVLSLDAIATPPAPKWRRMVGTVLLLVGIATTLYYAIIWGYWLYSVRGLPFTV